MSYKNINQGFDELLSKMKKKYSDSEESFEPEEIAYQTIIESKIMGFPKRYRDASFDKYQLVGTPEQQQRQKKLIWFLRANKPVVMYGNNGTGKTMLAFASIREQIEQSKSASYVSLLDIIDEVKETFGTGTSALRIIDKYVGYDYLVIDEMDKSYGSATEFLNIFRIVNGRYNAEKPTVLITNASTDDVIEIVGRSAYERIVEDGTAVKMDWDSYRKPGNKKEASNG